MELDEVKPDLWERHDWRYHAYLANLESAIWDHAAGAAAVIVGRGGNYILAEAPLCLRARVVAPEAVRVERIMARESISERARAQALVAAIDRGRAGYVRSNYGRGWEEAKAYDLTLDTGTRPLEEVAGVLARLLVEKDRAATPGDHERLAGLALAARLKARIANEPGLLLPTLAVRHAPPVIKVQAVIHNPGERGKIERLAREVCGDHPLRLLLKPRV